MIDTAGERAFTFRPIGYVRSPFTDPAQTPVQPTAAAEVAGEVIVEEAFAPGLKDIEGFSHLVLLYAFDRSGPARLVVTPFLDDVERGVFATRAPSRPNPIGLSLTRLVARRGNILHIAGVDVLDGTPVLDIKPYIPDLNPQGDIRVGWLAGKTKRFQTRTAGDARFASAPDVDDGKD